MKALTGAERVFTALQLKEPDRVPHFELGFDHKVKEKICPDSHVVEYFDWDAVLLDDRVAPGYRAEVLDASGRHFRDQWGVTRRVTAEKLAHPVEAAVKSEKDMEIWTPPDPDAPWRFQKLKELVRRYKGQKAIIAQFADPFTVANDVRGAADHFMDFVRDPALIDRLHGVIRDYYLRYIRNCIEAGAEIILVAGDYATSKHPMLSQEHLARYVMPALKALADEARSRGAYIVKHTDGNIQPIFDMVLDTGINGIHPIDPLAGMDLGVVKEKYGHRVCLLGNIDCAYVLTWGTTEEVREEVKRCIRQAARGGGYICMSSNTIHSAVKPENYVEMVKAIREYGEYPISI